MSDATRLYSFASAAKQFDVSESFIRTLVAKGFLRVVEASANERSKQRIRSDDLQAFIEARTFGRLRDDDVAAFFASPVSETKPL